MMRFAFASVLALTISPALADQRDFANANQALTDAVALPLIAALDEAAGTHAAVLADYCGATTADATAPVEAFDQHMDAWQRVQPLAFGPMLQGDGPARFQYWPDKHGTGAKQLRRALKAEDPALLQDGALAGRSVALGDLQALERVLFADTYPLPGSYGCDFAVAIANHQGDLAAELNDAWQQGFADEIRTAGDGNDSFYDASEPLRDYLAAIVDTLERVTSTKLERPLDRDLASARPKRAESWRSRRSLANIAANLETAQQVFAQESAFLDLLDEAGMGALANGVLASMELATTQIRAVPIPLFEAVSDATHRQAVVDVNNRLNSLRLAIGSTIANELGLVVGFNASDGD